MTVTVDRWLERRLRRATSRDLISLVTLTLLAMLTVIAGRYAHLSLRPRSAAELGEYLDELELPTRMPNAALVDAAGKHDTLFERIHTPRAVLAFYAPWCGPCQKELLHLAGKLGRRAQLLVVISADEDLEYTRRALANLDLSDLGFVVDVSGELQKQGRIKALPTTVLMTSAGAVLARTSGYSDMEIYRLTRKISSDDSDSASP